MAQLGRADFHNPSSKTFRATEGAAVIDTQYCWRLARKTTAPTGWARFQGEGERKKKKKNKNQKPRGFVAGDDLVMFDRAFEISYIEFLS